MVSVENSHVASNVLWMFFKIKMENTLKMYAEILSKQDKYGFISHV